MEAPFDELEQLCKLPRVDYIAVAVQKERFIRQHYREQLCALAACPDFHQFMVVNPWVNAYGLFKVLKEMHNWTSWQSWPAALRDPSPQQIQELCHEHQSEVLYHCLIQYLCTQQMKGVKTHASKKGVKIKGDIPILISPESVDVWSQRALFNLELSAGAPPDMYNEEGQNWGFPLFHWDKHQEGDYHWWRQRLEVAEKFYHLYRIDHVIGFYRLWGIPHGKSGREGAFYPEDPQLWLAEGEARLKMLLESSTMLPIAEDLGVIPPEVRHSLDRLGICGTKVTRWERDWNGDHSFLDPHSYSPLSMTCVSTHDSEPLRQWWQDYPKEAAALCHAKKWTYQSALCPEKQEELVKEAHQSASLFHINQLSEYLDLIDAYRCEDPEDLRINTPGEVNATNWTYRVKPSLEELRKSPELRALFRRLLDGQSPQNE
jgi:4-alpha-glucanotransferase